MTSLTVFILFGVEISLALASSLCEENSLCSCIRYPMNSYQVSCPKPLIADSTLTADYAPGRSFQIQCKNPSKIDFSLLEGLNVGPIKYFGLKFCPLPEITFKELMKSLKITSVTEIDFRSHSELQDNLSSRLFADLASVTRISLDNNGLTSLPENLFESKPNLMSISVWGNRLKSIPRHLFRHTPQLQVLELGANQLVNLEPEVFQNLTDLRLLNLWSNQLVNLTRSNFALLPKLEHLDLTSNGLDNLPSDVFADLVKLSHLKLDHNKFKHLSYGMFNGTLSLKKLQLNFNEKALQTLPSRFLANLTVLSEVSITQCNIFTLPDDLFWDSLNISTVSFEGNKLRKLPKDLFRDAKELQTVDFRNNKLEYLPDFLFSSTSKLRVAKFSNNNLQKISSHTFIELSELKYLDLQSNSLSHIEREAFFSLTSLIEINLSNNSLTFTDSQHELSGPINTPFQYCSKLEIVLLANNKIKHVFRDWNFLLVSLRSLDLSHNEIKKITKDDLNFVSNGVTVNLTNNKIATVDLQHIENFAQLEMRDSPGVDPRTHVFLGDNPIVCDCFIYDLVRYLEGASIPEVRRLINIDIGTARCAGPIAMRFTEVSTLNSKTLACSLDQIKVTDDVDVDPCPSNCLCSFRVHDEAIIVDCSNGNFTEIPHIIPCIHNSGGTELNMSYNELKKLPTNSIFMKCNFTRIDLSHNRIVDVEEVSFPKSLQVPKRENITCWPYNTRSIKSLLTSDLCPLALSYLTLFVYSTIAVLAVLVGFIAAACYFQYRIEIKIWWFSNALQEPEQDKKHDASMYHSILVKDLKSNIA